MKTKVFTQNFHLRSLSILLFFGAAVCGKAQTRSEKGMSVPEQKRTINIPAAKNADNTFYLLLYKTTNTSSKIAGVITAKSIDGESCKFEINAVLKPGADNKAINVMCEAMIANLVTVLYSGEQYFAVEIPVTAKMSDLSFTGYTENESLLLVTRNDVSVVSGNNQKSTALDASIWQTSPNGIYYAGGNVGIGTIFPNQSLTTTGNISLAHYGKFIAVASPSSGSYARVLGTDWANPVDRAALTTNGYVDTNTGNIVLDNTSLPMWALTLDANNDGFFVKRAAAGSVSIDNLKSLLTVKNSGNVGVGTTNPTATFDILGSNGNENNRNFRIRYFDYETNSVLGNTEFSALTHIPSLAGGNGWTALYAKQGSASKAGVFEGDVLVDGKFTVAGDIRAREIKVEANAGADFVFASDYRLRPLPEVERFIAENKHLPDIAPADSMAQNGVNMGEMQIQLLQKIEELTLYTIEQQKQIKALTEKVNTLMKNEE